VHPIWTQPIVIDILMVEKSPQVSQIEKLGSMLPTKKLHWTNNKIETEIKNLEAELLKATRELLDLENRYRADKMELLAKIEAHEERLQWFKSKIAR
jgi:hypothetical protein